MGLDIILFVFIISVLAFIRPRKKADESLSLESTVPLRGIMAVAIALHHFSEMTSEGRFFPFLQHIGYLIVAVFFFLSGYGLMVSYKKKGQDYLNHFWKKRILYLFIVCAVFTLIYVVYYIAVNQLTLPWLRAMHIWYLFIQIILYVIFWISFKAFKNNDIAAIGMAFALETILVVLLIIRGFVAYWYISNYAFLIGIIWGKYKKDIDSILSKHYIVSLAAAIICFAFFSGLPSLTGFSYDVSRILSAASFPVLISVIMKKITIVGTFWKWVGRISLEIYLLHGIIYKLLQYIISDEVLRVILTFIITISISIGAGFLSRKLKELLNR